MAFMPLLRRLVLLATLGLASIVPTTLAQDQAGTGPGESAEDVKPYTPPAAWKSVEIGNFYLKRKRYQGALSRYQEAVKTDPYYPQGYLGLGRVYEKLGLKRKALEAYLKYLDLLPSEKDALEAKGAQRAVSRLKTALKLDTPSNGLKRSAATQER